jgi:PST family polysaccharide transporter
VLGPESFGTFAVALVALMGILAFNELGVSLAIVRWPGEPRLIAPTVTTISVLASVTLCIAGWIAAPVYTAALGDPGATGVVRLLLLTVIIDGAVSTPAALLQRTFRQDKKAVADQANVWVGAGVSVVLAIAGLGPLSLALGRLAGSSVAAVLYVVFSPLPYRFGFDRTKARALLAFGLPLAGASIIVFAVGYADQLVVGGILGSTALGFYVLACNLAAWPTAMFSTPLRAVAPAAFARVQHDPAGRTDALLSMLGVLAAVTIPVCLLLAGAAPSVVSFVYGQEWLPAADALVWLAMLSIFRIAFELVYDYIVVLGFSRSILAVNAWWLAALLPAVIGGTLLAGIAGAALAQVVVAAVVVLPIYLWRLHRAGVAALAVLGRMWLPLLAGLLVGTSAAVLTAVIPSLFLGLLAAGVVALAVIALLLLRDRRALGRLRAFGQERPAAMAPAEGSLA